MDFEFGNVPSRAHELFHRLETQGAVYVEALVEAQKSEELFLDYKRISTPLDAKSLQDSDRANLRKALSGFANSEGGVILWGLETTKNSGVEAPKSPEGYADPARFVSLIEDAVSGCTVPPVPGVRSIKIPLSSDSAKGLVATLIPGSLIAPHQTSDDSRAYYMRAGSSFQRVPHGVLAGMFGRRPAAKVSVGHSITECLYIERHKDSRLVRVFLELSLFNSSNVVANDAYISWNARELGSAYSEITIDSFNGKLWSYTHPNGRSGSLLALESHRLAPYSKNSVIVLELALHGDITEGIDIDVYYGCAGSPPSIFRHQVEKSDLEKYEKELKEVVNLPKFDPFAKKKILKLGQSIFGIA